MTVRINDKTFLSFNNVRIVCLICFMRIRCLAYYKFNVFCAHKMFNTFNTPCMYNTSLLQNINDTIHLRKVTMPNAQTYHQQEFIAGIWFAVKLLLERIDAIDGDNTAKKYADFIIKTSGIDRSDFSVSRETIGLDNEDFLQISASQHELEKEV